jgi:hypothetical protein
MRGGKSRLLPMVVTTLCCPKCGSDKLEEVQRRKLSPRRNKAVAILTEYRCLQGNCGTRTATLASRTFRFTPIKTARGIMWERREI